MSSDGPLPPPARRGLLFIVSAPSGTGKTTLVERLVKRLPHLHMSRSYTSRPARAGEQDGVDYNFINRARFEEMARGGEFLEWADVFGNYYGTCAADTEACLARGEDVVLLSSYFLEQLGSNEGGTKRLSAAAVSRLRAHHWPGNVRELKNALHRAFILADTEIGPECLPSASSETLATNGSTLQIRVGSSVAESERRLILATLEECQGDKKRAAEVLQISLKTLYNRLNEYKIG